MQAVRHGCAAAIGALEKVDRLKAEFTSETATDLLWSILSVEMWEKLRFECGWSQEDYVLRMQRLTRNSLVG